MKAGVARCANTNIVDKARFDVSHGHKDSTKEVLGMVCGQTGQKTGTPTDFGVRWGRSTKICTLNLSSRMRLSIGVHRGVMIPPR